MTTTNERTRSDTSYWRRRGRMELLLAQLSRVESASIEELADHLDVSRATVYRYLAQLQGEQLVKLKRAKRYAAAPLLTHYFDVVKPILAALRREMDAAAAEHGVSQLACVLWRERVLDFAVVGDAWARAGTTVGAPRGAFSGAQAVAITAWRSDADLRLLARGVEGDPVWARPWRQVRDYAQLLRLQGYCMGSVDRNGLMFGVAAPVLSEEAPIASLTTLVDPIGGTKLGPEMLTEFTVAMARRAAAAGAAIEAPKSKQ